MKHCLAVSCMNNQFLSKIPSSTSFRQADGVVHFCFFHVFCYRVNLEKAQKAGKHRPISHCNNNVSKKLLTHQTNSYSLIMQNLIGY